MSAGTSIDSGVALTADTDTHLVFTTDGTNTYLYVNGALAHTFTGAAIDIAGLTGLGGALRPATVAISSSADSQVTSLVSRHMTHS